jgi:hypothetical protein
MTAIISFFSGMILQTIAHKNRQDFEMELQRVVEHSKRKKRRDKDAK